MTLEDEVLDPPLSFVEKVGAWTSNDGKVYIPQLQIPLYYVFKCAWRLGIIENRERSFRPLSEKKKIQMRAAHRRKLDEQYRVIAREECAKSKNSARLWCDIYSLCSILTR